MLGTHDITIRPLGPEDLEIYKTLRLQALKTEPGFFCSTHEDALKRSDEEWLAILNGPGKQLFSLFDGVKPVGLTGVFDDRDDPSGRTGMMVHSFIMPAYRGRGLSTLLYRARLEWARDHSSFTRLVVSHREGNEPSRRAVLRHGFSPTNRTSRVWPDGVEAGELNYEMDLNTLRGQKTP